jgi:hypothetical protein
MQRLIAGAHGLLLAAPEYNNSAFGLAVGCWCRERGRCSTPTANSSTPSRAALRQFLVEFVAHMNSRG